MQTLIIVRDVNASVPYWAGDETLAKARARYKRLTGKFPSAKASICAFTGTPEDINKIEIDDMGTINYPKSVNKVVIQ